MKINLVTFIKKLFLFTIILALIGFALSFVLPPAFLTPTLPYLYVFFFAVTLLVHYALIKVAEKRAASFINYFMLLTFGKLIFFLSIVLLYALIRREDAAPFIITFFILYMFFTVFEVTQSLSITKSLREKREEELRSSSDTQNNQ